MYESGHRHVFEYVFEYVIVRDWLESELLLCASNKFGSEARKQSPGNLRDDKNQSRLEELDAILFSLF
jgi:hypothetical protein